MTLARPGFMGCRSHIAHAVLVLAAAAIATPGPGIARATDLDGNGIEDERELPLARRFAPTLALHAPDIERNGIRVPVYPVPVEIMGLAGAAPGEGLPADRLFVLWRQQPLDYPYGDHWVAAAGWAPPLAESDPQHDYSALSDDPILRQIAPPAMLFGPYSLRFHWEYGNPAVDEPAEWYQVWESGNEWTRPGADFPPTAYAHLRRCEEAGCAPGRVLIQYWFFFPFNDWINNHEGDWEGMNVIVSSDDPDSATALDIEYFAHRIHLVRPPGMPLAEHCIITEATHPVAFVGGHGRLTGCIGGTGEGEASHGFYPTPGRFAEVSEGDPLGCFERADEEISTRAGPTVHWSDLAVEVIPAPEAIDTGAEPERGWLVADLLWGTRRVPSVGGALWHDVGNYAPHGPAHNPAQRFGRVAALTSTRPYSSPGDPHALPYAADEAGWVPFAFFLDAFTGMTSLEPGSLATWTVGTGTWELASGSLLGTGDGDQRATNRAFFRSQWPPDWYTLPFAEWNSRAARFAADVALLSPLVSGDAAGLAVSGAAGSGEGDGQVRVVLGRGSAGAYELQMRVWASTGDSLVSAVTVPDPGSATHRLEVLTFAPDGGGLFHDVWLDGALVLGSVATPGERDDTRGLVADGGAHARFDRVAFSGLRLESRWRHAPFASITTPAAGAIIYSCPQEIAWRAADEKADDGIATQRLALSIDGGATWEEIASLGGEERSLVWQPPAAAADSALIALTVTDVEGDSRTVRSGIFRLASGEPPASVLSPAGGESWMRGTTHWVRWAAPCRDTVDLALSTDGGATFPVPIAARVPNGGAFAWAIPSWLPVGQPCRVRIIGGGLPAATSPDFTLAWDGMIAGGDFEIESPWSLSIVAEAMRGEAASSHGIGDPPLGAPIGMQSSLHVNVRASGLTAPAEPPGAPDPDPPWPARSQLAIAAESEAIPLAEPAALQAVHIALRAIAIIGATPGAAASARATLSASYRGASGGELERHDLATLSIARTEPGCHEEFLDEILPLHEAPLGATRLRFVIRLEGAAHAMGPGVSAETEVVADDLHLVEAVDLPAPRPLEAQPSLTVHPDPTGGPVRLEIFLGSESIVSLSIFTAAGRKVARVISSRPHPPGTHAFTWDPGELPSGTYFFLLETGNATCTRKWVRLR